ncbi:MAG: 16S rRNA (cytosine(967)-C(5))-methyltransferase RsmB [Deferrisomatales bacterium]
MRHPPDARSLALDALDALERRDAYAEAVLDAVLSRHPELPPRDRALASHLVYGVLRWRNRLDWHLRRASSRPLERIHPRLLQVLRLGVYQILFLDRVPDRAAVHESVALARRAGLGHACGFANAVLRRVASRGRSEPLPRDPRRRLSLLFGIPEWLVERWSAEHGPEGAEVLCRAAARIPTLWLRIDPRRISREEALAELRRDGIEAFPGAFGPEAVGLTGAGDPRQVPLVRRGAALVQDQASQLVAHWLAPEPGWHILDACAAPGLKATHLLALAGSEAEVTALEIHPHRARAIAALGERLGCRGLFPVAADARTFACRRAFDAALVDAPCSGLGVLARTPEAKWRRRESDLVELPPLQLAILERAAEAVRPGGVLVYATCTTLRAENEAVVAAFLAKHPDYAPDPPPPGPVAWGELVGPDGFLRTYPGPATGAGARALDGFFAARLRRKGPAR